MSDPTDSILDPILTAAVRELKRGPEVPLSVESRVLAELARDARGRRRARWIPWLASAAAALLILGGAGVLLRGASPGRSVRFALEAPETRRVAVVGDFNNWDPRATPLEHHGRTWTVTLSLRPGRYRYTFVVDGARWVADPGRPPAADDDFATPTSVVTVTN
jgi:hypothetical protein